MKRRSGTRKLLVALAAGLIMTCLAAGTYLADGDLIGILMPTKEQTTWSNQARLLEEQFAAAGFTTSTERTLTWRTSWDAGNSFRRRRKKA